MSDMKSAAVVRYGPPHRARESRVIATGGPGLRLRFYPGVRADARALLKRFARWMRGRVAFRHPVRVTVVPRATVMAHEEPSGWAVFVIPPPDYTPGDVVRIYLGAGKVDVLERDFGFSHPDSVIRVMHDLAHEVVHYEQWRDGREVTERGVNRRATAWVNRFCAEVLRYARPPLA
ncbi:MAG TPA: hypothetical protein VF158_10135 [Longimicrobiales bacterium]